MFRGFDGCFAIQHEAIRRLAEGGLDNFINELFFLLRTKVK